MVRCNSSRVCFLEEPLNPCDIIPPPVVELKFLQSDPGKLGLWKNIIEYRNSHRVWNSYLEECHNITATSLAPSTTAYLSSTPSTVQQNVSSYSTLGGLSTPFVPNITVGAQMPEEQRINDWIIPVISVVSFLCLLCIAVFMYKIYRYFHSTKRGTTHPVEIPLHENVNFLNNKAEEGQKWRGHNLESRDLNRNAAGNDNFSFDQDIPQESPPPIPHHSASLASNSEAAEATPVVYANHQFQKLNRRLSPIDFKSHKDIPLPETPPRPVPAKRPKKF